MGQGIEFARKEAPAHAAIVDDFKDQLLLAFVRRLGGSVDVPVNEVDATGGFVLAMAVVDRVFQFRLQKKN